MEMIAPVQKLIRTEDSAHWYDRTGKPMHRVIGKNGKEKNTTIREARSMSLLPSVTSILKMYPKPSLDNWKTEQAILSALTLPRVDGETDDVFAHRVVEDSKTQARMAAEFGTKIHNAIAGDPVTDPAVNPFLEKYSEWATKTIHKTIWKEKVLTCEVNGYAGRADSLIVDMVGRCVLVDFKCRAVKDRENPPVYETDLMQLMAYAKAEGGVDQVASIIIDSQTPQEPIFYVWPLEDMDHSWKTFLACLNLWKHINNFGL